MGTTVTVDTVARYVQENLAKIQGWCSPEKAQRLLSCVAQNKPRLCVEIGVFGGSSLFPIACGLKYNKYGFVHGIDPWAKDAALDGMLEQQHIDWWSKVDLEAIKRGCYLMLEQFQLRDYAMLWTAQAEDIVDLYADNSIDLLHVDGNHSEDHSAGDVEHFMPKLKSGGYIFVDDIYWSENQHVTTQKAVQYVLEHCTRVDVVSDCLIARKK